MKIKVVKQPFGLAIVTNQMFHAINGRLSIVTYQVVSIEIVASGVQSIESLLYSIRVEHGNHNYLKMLDEKFCLF